jgi:hypothetical protein
VLRFVRIGASAHRRIGASAIEDIVRNGVCSHRDGGSQSQGIAPFKSLLPHASFVAGEVEIRLKCHIRKLN